MPVTQGATSKDSRTNKFKVRLREATAFPFSNSTEQSSTNVTQNRGRIKTNEVAFDVTPDLTETRNVEYKSMNPIHMPGNIYVYGSTSSRIFGISSIKLISRTIAEATANMQTLWTLRGWTMPRFGKNSSTASAQQPPSRQIIQRLGATAGRSDQPADRVKRGQELLGQPPAVLLLSAYSDLAPLAQTGSVSQARPFATNIANVPVVITSLSIPYPADVDYIPDENGQPIPRVMVIDIQCVETRAPREFTEQFSLQQYRSGTLPGF